MKVYLISDTHFNHANIATYCDRPADFTDIIIRNCIQSYPARKYWFAETMTREALRGI
jgi:calcineurin-like phosphoesterase family protein